MAATRQAQAFWTGDLAKGSGEVSARSSGRFDRLPVSWAARTEAPDGKTSPEELLAAAHASCFCMALSHELAEAGTPPERLEATATVDFEPGEGVRSSRIVVRGRVPDVDPGAFNDAARAAGEGCPISGALKGNVEVTVEATLES